jgi:hypothetical protein
MRLEEIITSKLEGTVRGVLLVGRSERGVDRDLADGKERGDIETFRMLVPCVSDTRPLHVHVPGQEPPDFDAFAYFAKKRSLIDVATETFIVATRRLMDREGGCFHSKIRDVDAAHHCRAAWVFHSLSEEEQAAWVPAKRLGPHWEDAESLPDAMIGDELVEIVGRYPAAKMRARHARWSNFTYRLY